MQLLYIKASIFKLSNIYAFLLLIKDFKYFLLLFVIFIVLLLVLSRFVANSI